MRRPANSCGKMSLETPPSSEFRKIATAKNLFPSAISGAGKQERLRQSWLTLVQKFVIENAGCEPRVLSFFWQVLGASNPSLAEHGAVFLAGNLLGHLENHLHQGVVGKALRTLQQHTRLAEVRDRAFIPASKILHAVPHGRVEFEAPG